MYEPDTFRPLAQVEKQSETVRLHYVVTDLTGTARELCSEDGEVHWRGEQALWDGYKETKTPISHPMFPGDAANDEVSCDLRYPGQLYDAESGLYYNRYRYYDPDLGQYLSSDPIGLAGGIRPQGYVHNPVEWIDPLGLIPGKPPNSPDPIKWVAKGGTVGNESDGTWVYKNAAGTTVRYPDGYPDFGPHAVQQVDVPNLMGNHGRSPLGDFGKADALAPNGPADYLNNTWHHHQNGIAMQEVPKSVHSEFTHKGGVSNIKNKTCS